MKEYRTFKQIWRISYENGDERVVENIDIPRDLSQKILTVMGKAVAKRIADMGIQPTSYVRITETPGEGLSILIPYQVDEEDQEDRETEASVYYLMEDEEYTDLYDRLMEQINRFQESTDQKDEEFFWWSLYSVIVKDKEFEDPKDYFREVLK